MWTVDTDVDLAISMTLEPQLHEKMAKPSPGEAQRSGKASSGLCADVDSVAENVHHSLLPQQICTARGLLP